VPAEGEDAEMGGVDDGAKEEDDEDETGSVDLEDESSEDDEEDEEDGEDQMEVEEGQPAPTETNGDKGVKHNHANADVMVH
jgi:histone chaperone ASF1